jgi:tetratricopeptide (TPR) repeat protein
MGKGPLADPKLRAIEERLNAAHFDDAQRMLADLAERDSLRPGVTYLATRLLYQRGRLDEQEVIERLREVVRDAEPFPEATAMLAAAESGLLAPDASSFLTATMPPLSSPTLHDPRQPESWHGRAVPEIPRAPAVPQVARQSEPVSPRVRARARDTLQEFVSRDPPSSGKTGPGSAQPPSSGSAWRAKHGRDTAAPSSRPTDRVAPSAFDLGPRRQPSTHSPSSDPRPEPPPDFTRKTGGNRSTLANPHAGRSVRPAAPEEDLLPTALTIASLLDDGEPARALALLDRWEGPLNPELVILRARSLWALDRRAAALADLERVGNAPLVEPELRASAARLLIDMDDLERAVQQARHAYQDEPGSILVRLTLAWALVRAGRRSGHVGLYQQAESLLSALRPRATPLPALVHGLRASIAAELDDTERALVTAQLALGLDPHAVDALAALAVASAKVGRGGDARRAWLRLREVNGIEAEALATSLALRGVELDMPEPSSRQTGLARSAQIWEPLELDLVGGKREAAIGAFERTCADHARDPQRRVAAHDYSALALDAARFFTAAPVFRHFAPYDLSLASTSRLEAALSVLYGSGPRLNPVTGRHPVLLLIGAYLGECVRQAFDGRWRGTLQNPQQAAVEARDHEYAPFERVEQRLRVGRSVRLDTEVLAHPAAEPNAQRIDLDLAPPTPWDPDDYPSAELFPKLGRAFAQSVVALYTGEYGGGPLDTSLTSVAALDSYVSLLAPPTVAPEGSGAWVRRASILIGAYLIDVLCENMGGFFAPNELASGPLVYEVVFDDSSVTHPVLHAYERLSGKRMTPLGDYVARLSRRLQ